MLCLALLTGTIPGIGREAPPRGISDQASQDLSIETRDGLVTAGFSDRTDESIFRTAMPTLIAKGVQSISLRGAPIRDIGPISALPNLKVLDISGTQVRDLTPLASLTGLASLDLQFLRLSDLRPLAGLAGLRTLNIGGTEVRDLTPIGSLTDLRELSATVTRITDLTPISGLRSLTSLNLSSTWVGNIRPLAGMTNLRFLSLNGTPVDDIAPLSRLVALQTLDLGGTQVSDVRPLAGMRDLRSLDLEGTLVADAAPLAGLTSLRSVALGGSHVRDMTPLAHLAIPPAAAPAPPEEDPVLVWNDLANRSIQATATDAFEAPRALAMESIAVLDTIKSIDGTPAFLVRLPPPRDVSPKVAVAAAAHAILVHLFPSRRAVLDGALAAALLREPAGPALSRGVAFGEAMADAVMMLRDEDGSMAPPGPVRPASAPGDWRPTPPGLLPPAHPQWALMQPFAMNRPDQFRPAGPPPLRSDTFRRAKAEVEALGADRSTIRTPDQTLIAHYWSDALGTYAPAGHWNAIAANIVTPLRLGIAVEAELFAELNVAMADASVAVADAKYTYWWWRPVTAIRAGGDGGPAVADWTPLLETPNHPSYISGHSTFSGAAATVLTAWFGGRPFTFSSASVPGVTRHFTSFQQAAEEAAASRLYGGIHYGFDNADGLATGRSIGAWTMGVFERIGDDRGPIVMLMDRSMPTPSMEPNAVVGCALDNLSPVTEVTVRLDGGAPFTLTVNERGLFVVPPERLGTSIRHQAVLTAISASGRNRTVAALIE